MEMLNASVPGQEGQRTMDRSVVGDSVTGQQGRGTRDRGAVGDGVLSRFGRQSFASTAWQRRALPLEPVSSHKSLPVGASSQLLLSGPHRQRVLACSWCRRRAAVLLVLLKQPSKT